MRILILHLHDSHFQMGGADKGVLDLSAALQERGNQVHVISNAGPFAEAVRKKGLTVIEIPHSKAAVLKTLNTICREIKNFQPEVMHSHHRYLTFLLDCFFKGRGIPILHTQRVQASNKKFLFRYGHFLAAVSESLRRHMVSHYQVPESRSRAIVNAVSLRPADASAVQALKQKYKRAEGEVFALCAGRFHEQKGHIYLIEALSKLDPPRRKKIRIFLAGDGPLEVELKGKIKQLELESNFVFTGYLETISDYLGLCDFLVLPSLWEGLPRAVLESFTAGLPAVATDIPGNSDVIESGKNGVLVPARNAEKLSEALARLIDHPEDLARMKEGARQSASKYSFEAMVQNYQQLYQELVRER